jgi:hypothetical protein
MKGFIKIQKKKRRKTVEAKGERRVRIKLTCDEISEAVAETLDQEKIKGLLVGYAPRGARMSAIPKIPIISHGLFIDGKMIVL